jgi:hypothetical protein
VALGAMRLEQARQRSEASSVRHATLNDVTIDLDDALDQTIEMQKAREPFAAQRNPGCTCARDLDSYRLSKCPVSRMREGAHWLINSSMNNIGV